MAVSLTPLSLQQSNPFSSSPSPIPTDILHISGHFAEGAYDIIATTLFKNLNAHTFYLEYDTARAGGFEPLKHLPAHKNVIVGIVSTKVPQLEDQEEMVSRVRRAAEYIAEGDRERGGGSEGEEEGMKKALARMGVSPQCGFSTHETGYPLSWEEQRAKLELVRAVAEKVWPGEP